MDPAPDAKPASRATMQTVLIVICVAATVALLVAGVFFYSYYLSNSDKLFIADIDYRRDASASGTSLVNVAFGEAATLGKRFEWGGCRSENLDKMENTFRLHCWGIENKTGTLDREIQALQNTDLARTATGPRKNLRVTKYEPEKLTESKKMLILFAAFCHHKLHLDLLAPEKQ